MADSRSKKFYWIKLEKNFFKRHDIRVIESMDNGKDYLLFYMKLLLESTSHEGYLRFNEVIPYDEKMLSVVTDTNIDIVRSAVQLFRGLNLMEVLDDKTIYMNELHKMLGSETEHAIQKRLLREKEKEELLLLEGKETMSPNVSIHASISNSKSISESNTNKDLIKQVIEYLNSKLDTRFRVDSNETLINPRIEEGRTYEDFVKVIDTKYDEWNGTDMAVYLRPKTLFNKTNFENYLNQVSKKPKVEVINENPYRL